MPYKYSEQLYFANPTAGNPNPLAKIGYCPLNSSVRNPIDYTPTTPTPLTIGYCPLDNSVRNPVPFSP